MCEKILFLFCENKKLSYREQIMLKCCTAQLYAYTWDNARDSLSVEIFSTTVQLYEKSHLGCFRIGE